ncbi:hypothetical protein BGZ83_003183, partial [Gryganskiella cystojenkinii]
GEVIRADSLQAQNQIQLKAKMDEENRAQKVQAEKVAAESQSRDEELYAPVMTLRAASPDSMETVVSEEYFVYVKKATA